MRRRRRRKTTVAVRWISREALRGTVFRNVAVLSGLQVASYVFPLATVPYLTRVLGPTAWGLLAFAAAFGAYVTLLVEYGFNLSATREVALFRDAREKLADLLAGVLGAKVLIALVVVGAAFVAYRLLPPLGGNPIVLYAAFFAALSQSLTLMWFYQGLERMRTVAVLEIASRATATAGIFVFVREPDDAWKVLALYGTASSVAGAVALSLAYREVPFRFPTPGLVWDALRMGWNSFVFNGSVSLYTVGNAFVLGLFAPHQFVGYYAGAEKLVTSLLRLFEPVSQAVYPRLNHLFHHERDEAMRLARFGAIFMIASGVLMGLGVFLLAPLLVRVLLGEGYEPAVPVLRVLALVLPMATMSTALHIQWILPLRLDRAFNAFVLGAGLLNLLLALVLAPLYYAQGMAWAVVCSEVVVSAGSVYLLLRWRNDRTETGAVTWPAKGVGDKVR